MSSSFKYFKRLSDHQCFGLLWGCFQPASVGLKSSRIFEGRCDGILRRWLYHHRVHSANWMENSICYVVCGYFLLLTKLDNLRPSILLWLFVWNMFTVLRAVIGASQVSVPWRITDPTRVLKIPSFMFWLILGFCQKWQFNLPMAADALATLAYSSGRRELSAAMTELKYVNCWTTLTVVFWSRATGGLAMLENRSTSIILVLSQ